MSQIKAKHNGENIREKFESVLREWTGAKEKLYSITRDGAAANKLVCTCKIIS